MNGNIFRDTGEFAKAVEWFRNAVDLARESKSTADVCWAGLRLFLALADHAGPDAAITYLATLRRDILRLGDPLASAALHLFVAQVEAKRGLVDRAREHIRIGRSLLLGSPSSWLEAMAAIDAACLAFDSSDFRKGWEELKKALSLAQTDGHCSLKRAALANMGHLLLAEGRYARASGSLRRALRISPGVGTATIGILDGLAQIALLRGRYQQAESFLGRTKPWSPDDPPGTWYYGLWTCLTRAKVMLRENRDSEALELLDAASQAGSKQPDPTLATRLNLLRAEALARLGRHEDAAVLVARASETTDIGSIEMMAEIARVSGHALAAAGDVPGAARHFERAARILATIGNRSGRADTLDAWSQHLWGHLKPPSSPSLPPAPPGDLPSPPRRVTFRLDTVSPLVTSALCPAALAADRASAIIEAGGYPEVLGQELLHLVFESACVKRAALFIAQAGHALEVVRWFGCDWHEARALAANPPRRLDAGNWHGRHFTLALDPPPDSQHLTTLMAIERLARSARWQHEARRNERERAALWPIEPGGEVADAVFINEEMNDIVRGARKVAAVALPVLLTGETGTGKEVLARVIHAASPRAERPFVPFNCTAVPREMIDSQLFGYRRGAFTGAVADFPGVIRAAQGGTLFLDEVGELGPDVQPKLLRFLESGEIQPLGDPKPAKVDVRVVASTNADLERHVADGRFRQDLFYRLNVVRFRLPPLRERREEIPPLAEHFLMRAARDFKKDNLRLSEETMEYLVLYRWPGNVRQLANEMRRLAAFAEPGALVMPEHLDPLITAERRTIPASDRTLTPSEVVVRLDQPLAAAVEHLERASMQYALRSADGRLEEAAALLGLSRKGLYLKRQRLGLADGDA